jgi:hypothetical protein
MVGQVWEFSRFKISKLLSLWRMKRRSRRRSDGRAVALHAEWLEQRELLSVNQITFDSTSSAIVIQGTSDADQAEVRTDASGQIRVSLTTPGETVTASFAKSTVALIKFIGGDGDDRFSNGTDIPSVAWGGAGNDVLYGGSGADRLYGEDGNDLLSGWAGIDRLDGGAGNDRLFGGDGNDVLIGNEGDDELNGEDGDDRLSGWAGNDRLDGGAGNDELFGNEGNDRLAGSDGNDLLDAGTGDDMLLGGAGVDRLFAGSGNDVLIGGAGADELFGQAGEDILLGGMTSFDNNSVKLSALALAWSAAVPYSTRIQQIQQEAFAARLMSVETVFDDAVADAVYGGDGQDWFFQTGFLGVYDPNHGSSDEQLSGGGPHQHPAAVILDHPPELEGFALLSALDAFSDRQPSEAIQSSLPHVDDPVLQREHLALYEIARYDEVTNYAVQDGAWSNPATWSDGVVPADSAHVLIPINVEVQVDGVIATRLATIFVDGMLSFDSTRNTELRVDTLLVSNTGTFQMGTEESPIAAGVKARLLFTDNGPIDRTLDPFGISRGLLSHGSVSIHGTEVSSYTALAGPAVAGALTLVLQDTPVGWKAGDTIVIAATSTGTAQNEVRKISSNFGNTIVLNQPLAYSHVSPASDLDVHVANVTRNAVFESEGTAIEQRGHVMFMHNRDVDIAYAGFYRLGRTNKLVPINDPVVDVNWVLQPGTGTNPRARYPVHFHRNGLVNDGNPSVVRGSAVVDAPGWGFVNHSSYVDILDNVAFDVMGAAFSTEVGDEIGSFRDNLAMGTRGSGAAVESRSSIQDFGHAGDGFWFQGVGISVSDNVSAGNAGTAFSYYARALVEGGVQKKFLSANLPDPSIAGGAEKIDIGKMPLFEFTRNIGYASAGGLATWYLMEKAAPDQSSVLQDSTFWNDTVGVNLGYTRHAVLRNLKVVHVAQSVQPLAGLRVNAVTANITYENLTVSGYRHGLVLPKRGTSVVIGGQFSNRIDILIYSGFGRNALITGIQGTPRIVMAFDRNTSPVDVTKLFREETVILDFGPFNVHRLYYVQQAANAVPFPEPREGLPPEYVGLTNQQLWDQYGVALAGGIAPSNAFTVPYVTGLIAPSA